MSNALMRPANLRTAATFDKATDILRALLTSVDSDELGEAMEAAASDADLANAVIFRLLVVARGWDDADGQATGVELVARSLSTTGELILPASKES